MSVPGYILTNSRAVRRVGSRETCNPPPVGTDEDFLVLLHKRSIFSPADPKEAFRRVMEQNGFREEGAAGMYGSGDGRGFLSYRRGDQNFIVTADPEFFEKFLAASSVAKRLNLLDKADRIALFQAVLYGKEC